MTAASAITSVLVKARTFSGAQISTLFSAPSQLIPPPGPGRMLQVINVTVEFALRPGSLPIGGNPALFYADGNPPTNANQLTNTGAPVLTDPPAHLVATLDTLSGLAFDPATVANLAVNVGIVTADPGIAGPIATTTIDTAGTGYAIGDTGHIVPSQFGPNATYRVDTVDIGTGAVLTYTITNPGTGFDGLGNPYHAVNSGAQPGIGINFALGVATIAPVAGVLAVTAAYNVVTLH